MAEQPPKEKKAPASKAAPPVIVRRVKKSVHGHHGGSWKVAFADFATAMMAFFLVLWLIGTSTEEEKAAISEYFQDPGGAVIGPGGANKSLIELEAPASHVEEPDPSIDPESVADLEALAEQQEMARLEALKQELEELVATSDAFAEYRDQIIIDITPSGLRIQIVDRDKRPMFDSGSADLKFYSRSLLYGLAKVIQRVPNKLSITGHTDSDPFVDRDDYTNWELSADRANAARRALVRGGIRRDQVAKVEGFADSVLYDQSDPRSPVNRRIAIIVLKPKVAAQIEQQAEGHEEFKIP